MNSDTWQQVDDLLNDALELEPSSRRKFLAEISADDLRCEVESLLEAEAETEHFLASPAVALSTSFFTEEDLPDALAGQNIGSYKIVRELGRGGMGAVYLAERDDGKFSQRVAIKLLKRELNTTDIRRRFAHERQILSKLEHPNIARLLDAGSTDDGLPYLVMEYVEGVPVDSFCAENDLSLNERLELFRTICDAVAFAHRNLVIHRDLKPSNILVTSDGTPKLLDFGISKLLTPDFADDSEHTVTKLGAMTPEYASPEQLRGESVTTATDVYSLGVILYELLTTHRPFEFKKQSTEEIIRAVCTTDPQKPSEAVTREERDTGNKTKDQRPKTKDRKIKTQTLRGDLDNIALKALKKEPERRYSSVEQFAEDIRRHLVDLPVLARPDTLSYRATKFVNRNKVAVVAGLLITLSLIAGVIATVWQARRAEVSRLRAERRFNDVRKLSNSLLFEITPKIERLQGSTEAREILVKRALEYLDSLAQEAGDDSQLQSELAAAYEKVGDLQGNPTRPNLSNFAGAILSYEKANRIRRNLPATTEHQLLLAANLSGLADIRYTQNDVKGGMKDYEEALKIHETLLSKEPESYDLQIAYLRSKFDIAETYVHRNKFAAAVPLLREIVVSLERLDQNKLATRTLLATTYSQVGNALSWDNKQPEAEIEMAKATAITDRLAAEYPNDTSIQHTVFKIYSLASSIYDEVSPQISLQFAYKMLKITEQAVASDAADVQSKQYLAQSFSRIGITYMTLKRYPEAVANLEKAEKIFLELLEREPANRSYQHFVGILYTRFGDTKEKQGDLPGALTAFQQSAYYFERTFESDEKNLGDRRNLAQSLKSVGNIHLELGEKEKAKENFQKALEILNQLKAQNALGEWDKTLLNDVRTALEKLQ